MMQDDRTFTQISANVYPVVIGGRDTFLSGWGKAKGGKSYAFWACRAEHADRVERWVRERGDIRNIRRRGGSYTPQLGANDHCHIYIADDNHPAITGEE